jgi:hypothetical protein
MNNLYLCGYLAGLVVLTACAAPYRAQPLQGGSGYNEQQLNCQNIEFANVEHTKVSALDAICFVLRYKGNTQTLI